MFYFLKMLRQKKKKNTVILINPQQACCLNAGFVICLNLIKIFNIIANGFNIWSTLW